MGDVMMRTLSYWAKPLLALPRPAKRLLVLALDAGLCVLAVWLAFLLRLEKFVPLTGPAMWAALSSVVLALPIFLSAGLYRAIFRYSGLSAMMAVGRAMLLYGVLFAAVFAI